MVGADLTCRIDYNISGSGKLINHTPMLAFISLTTSLFSFMTPCFYVGALWQPMIGVAVCHSSVLAFRSASTSNKKLSG